jgi:hypothetical protein
MPYKLKVQGLREAQKHIKDEIEKIKVKIKEISEEKYEIILGGITIDFSLKMNGLDTFINQLPQLIKKAHDQTLDEIASKLKDALDASIQSPVWDWEGDTRDIVDTGKLKDSLVVSVEGGSINVLYGEDYAAIVHYGGYFNPYGNPDIKQYYPGRPWVDSVLNGQGPVDQFDFEKEYNSIFTQKLAGLIR